MSKYKFTSRTKARKRAADVVFEADQRGMGSNSEILRDLLRERKVITAALTPLPEYSIRIIEGVAEELHRIDTLIDDHANVAGLDRIPAVDLAVMRVAVWEMLSGSEDVPAVIAIDEAISIVKSISTDASPNFVNAVLDAIRKEISAPSWKRTRVHDDETYDDQADGEQSQTTAEVSNGRVKNEAEELSFEDFASGIAEPMALSEQEVLPSETNDEMGTGPAPDPTEQPESVSKDLSVPSEPRDALTDEKHYPTLADISAADLDELDELLDEY